MSYLQAANISPQYSENAGWWIKFYQAGTTTPISFSIDNDGSTLLSKAELDVDGFIVTSGGAKFTPYLNAVYDAFLFPTETEANNNDTTNADKIADNVILPNSFQSNTSITLDEIKNLSGVEVGQRYIVSNFNNAPFTVVSSEGGTPNATWFIQSNIDESKAFQLSLKDNVSILDFGAIGGDVTKDTAAWLGMFEYAEMFGCSMTVAKSDGNFTINYPAYSFSGMDLKMHGIVENILESSDITGEVNYGQQFCILIGNAFNTAFTDSTSYNCDAISVKDNKAVVSSSAIAGNFSSGDIVALYSTESITYGTNPRPDFQMMNEVDYVDGATIYMRYALKESLGGSQPKITNMSDTGINDPLGHVVSCVKDIKIQGLGGFKSNFERWTGYGGMLRANIDLGYVEADDILSLNGVSFSKIDISGVFHSGGYELAYFSHDSSFKSSNTISYKDTSSAFPNRAFVIASEQARRLTFDYIFGEGETGFLPAYVLTSTGANDITFGDNISITSNASVCLINCSGVGTGTFQNTTFGRLRIQGDSVVGARVLNSTGTIKNTEVLGSKLDGTFSTYGINILAEDTKIDGLYHKTGDVNIQSGSSGTILTNLSSDSVRDIANLGDSTFSMHNYKSTYDYTTDGRFIYISIGDDNVFSKDIVGLSSLNLGKISWTAGTNLNNRGVIHYNYSVPACVVDVDVTGSSIDASTAVLTGTTGTDGRITASVASGGIFYLENRTGLELFLAIELNN